jgi:hypothetical protein
MNNKKLMFYNNPVVVNKRKLRCGVSGVFRSEASVA